MSEREKGYWDGFEAALDAVLEGQRLYGTTRKAVVALRIAARIGRAANAAAGSARITADLTEQGRRLASQRDDLIAQGVDPAELETPIAPADPTGAP